MFLHRGLLAAEELLPGLRQDILDAGAIRFDTGDLAWLGQFGWNTRQVNVFHVLSTSRPLLEVLVRRRVAALSGVEIRATTEVVGLARPEGGWQVHVRQGSPIDADLVIDASGRASRLPKWLAGLGHADVRTTEIDARIGYATRVYAAMPTLPRSRASSWCRRQRSRPAGEPCRSRADGGSSAASVPVTDGHPARSTRSKRFSPSCATRRCPIWPDA